MPGKPKTSRPQTSTATTFSVYGKAVERDIELCAKVWADLDEADEGFIDYARLKMGLARMGFTEYLRCSLPTF